jgi:single-strand DNA-binding protein
MHERTPTAQAVGQLSNIQKRGKIMAGSMNRATLVGNLGKDPEIRNTQSGMKIANLTIATSESWTDKQTGELREQTEWHRVTIFSENLADIAERYLKKGHKVLVEGALHTRKWTDQQGIERYSTEIVLRPYNGNLIMLGGNSNSTQNGSQQHGGQQNRQERGGQGGAGSNADLDDDIPF